MNTNTVPVLSGLPVEFPRRGESLRDAAERRFGAGVRIVPTGLATLGAPYLGVVRRFGGPSYRVFPAQT